MRRANLGLRILIPRAVRIPPVESNGAPTLDIVGERLYETGVCR
jgi:hypothetical protein